MTARLGFIWGGFFVLIFLGALFWAKQRDPFSRDWFTLNVPGLPSLDCVTLRPKTAHRHPVIIYAHGSNDTLITDGNDLRRMAELGLAVVGLRYDQSDAAVFDRQFDALLRYLETQEWADINATAWVGFNLGADRMLDFALRHQKQRPQLLVLLSVSGMDRSGRRLGQADSTIPPSPANVRPSSASGCSVLLVHSERDAVFPVADAKRLISFLRTEDLSAELRVIPGRPYGIEVERGAIFHGIAEYCRSHLVSGDPWQNYQSTAQWEKAAPRLGWFWLPAAIWAAGWFAQSRYSKVASLLNVGSSRPKTSLVWIAIFLAVWSGTETAIHFITPWFPVNPATLKIAREYLLRPTERADLEYITALPPLRGQQLKHPLEHIQLAGYDRELVPWELDNIMYRDFVLSPVIADELDGKLSWRRTLWQEFYPYIRKIKSPENVAKTVVRHLRESMTVAALPNPPHDVPGMWAKRLANEAGFEMIYVAALRSVGVPARLDSAHKAEIWDGTRWTAGASPLVLVW